MFEGLFPDADKLNLEEMQRRLDEQQAAASLISQSLRNRFGAIANSGNLLRCIGHSRSAKKQKWEPFDCA
jgi:hypothetical protein